MSPPRRSQAPIGPTGEESFARGVTELASELGRDPAAVEREASAAIHEMSARHSPAPLWVWRALGRRLIRRYDVRVDERALGELRALDDDHTLVWLPSHRSYVDTWILPKALDEAGFPPYYVFGGANLSFWPFGDVARRTGLVFIRRNVQNDPVYRMALRHYLAHLVRLRADFGWSIEGGRTRTGKLRPPRYGLLRYLSDAVLQSDEPDTDRVLLVPVSIVYDRLPEVATMVAEAHGRGKQSEDLRWLVEFVRGQERAGGQAYVDFGEPIPLGRRLAELAAEPEGRGHEVERVALDVCHRINRVTPVVPGAVVTIALLSADRGLTMDELIEIATPLADYFHRRGCPVACDGRLDDRSVIASALDELVAAGAAIRHDGGRQPVWALGRDQHLVAAFYRNSAVHFLVGRAVAELAGEAARDAPKRDRREAEVEAGLALRDLLKFDFFFAPEPEFREELEREIELLDSDEGGQALAPLVLRPFLESYLVVADCLCALAPGARIDDEHFLRMCLGVAGQWQLQRRLHSAESVSLELFRSGLRLARHRGLDAPDDPQLSAKREAFADELRQTLRRIARLEQRSRIAGSDGTVAGSDGTVAAPAVPDPSSVT